MRLFALVLVVLGLVASPARAQDAAASAADALFQNGKRAMDAGAYDDACASFRESFRLQAAVGTLLNLGTCEERRGHPALALQCFRDSVALLGDGDFRRAYAEDHLRELRPKVATARLVFDGVPPAGLHVSQDSVELGPASLGLDLNVDPGDHVFAASAPGFEPQRKTVHLAAGEHADVALRLEPSPPKPIVSKQTMAPDRPPAPVGPWVLMGTGAAVAVTGAVLGLVVRSAASEVKDHCDASGCDPTGLDAADRGRPLAVLSPLLLGAGAAMIGAGVVWFTIARTSGGPTVSLAGTF